jgi:hypothetical protein
MVLDIFSIDDPSTGIVRRMKFQYASIPWPVLEGLQLRPKHCDIPRLEDNSAPVVLELSTYHRPSFESPLGTLVLRVWFIKEAGELCSSEDSENLYFPQGMVDTNQLLGDKHQVDGHHGQTRSRH